MGYQNLTEIYVNMNSTMTQRDQFHSFYLVTRRFTGLILYPIVSLFGLFANAFGVIVFTRRGMRTPTNVFCIALAATDSTKIINDILYFVVVLITEIPGADWKRIFISLYPVSHYVFHTTMMAAFNSCNCHRKICRSLPSAQGKISVYNYFSCVNFNLYFVFYNPDVNSICL